MKTKETIRDYFNDHHNKHNNKWKKQPVSVFFIAIQRPYNT